MTISLWCWWRRRSCLGKNGVPIAVSDAAAVLGISLFRTAVDLYYNKRNLPIEDNEGNWAAMEAGNLLEDFGLNNVQAQVPPPYFEDDGDLALESLRQLMGPSSKDAHPVLLTPPQSAKIFHYLELKEEKSWLDAEVSRLEAEMKRVKALIVAVSTPICTLDERRTTCSSLRRSGGSRIPPV